MIHTVNRLLNKQDFLCFKDTDTEDNINVIYTAQQSGYGSALQLQFTKSAVFIFPQTDKSQNTKQF